MIKEVEKILEKINLAINILNELSVKYQMYRKGIEPFESTNKVLNLLKDEIQNNPISINKRVLRAMHDIGMSSYKDFENTEMENGIIEITSILYKDIPYYRKLEPLRMDFGKGDPI